MIVFWDIFITAASIYLIIAGLIFMIFHKKFARKLLKYDLKFIDVPLSKNVNRYLPLAQGIIFTIMGILFLLKGW